MKKNWFTGMVSVLLLLALVFMGCPTDDNGDPPVIPGTGDEVVDDYAILLSQPYDGGEVADFVVANTAQYTGAVVWKDDGGTELEDDDTFVEAEEYTAVITLTAATGYTFTGMTRNFTVADADSVQMGARAGTSATVTAVFTALGTPVLVPSGTIAGIDAPVAGAVPGTGTGGTGYAVVSVEWDPTIAHGVFAPATEYTATITLSATSGYFFTGIAADAFTVGGETGSTVADSATAATVTVTFPETGDIPVSDSDIILEAPATGETPVDAIDNVAEYTGTVVWNPAIAAGGTFASGQIYRATITLTAKPGYTFTGVPENFFNVPSADSTTNAENSNVVIAIFPATVVVPTVVDIDEIPGVRIPAFGAVPDTEIDETLQYTGSITWSPTPAGPNGTFVAGQIYTATIILDHAANYTFAGLAADFFKVAGATSVSFNSATRAVTAAFPATVAGGDIVAQLLNYLELAGDVPNPDRGFYVTRTVTPAVSGAATWGGPTLSTTIAGSSAAQGGSVSSRIVYLTVDLRNFSSNAPTGSNRPNGPWTTGTPATVAYGTSQAISADALTTIRNNLTAVRNSEAVAILKFTYDEAGRTYIDSGNWDMVVHDCEPGAGEGRAWHEAMYAAWIESGGLNGTTNGSSEELVEAFDEFRNEYRENNPPKYTEENATSDSCGIPGHEEKNWVEYQLWQLRDIFTEFEDVIMVVKGGIFGAWGEMHSSSYARTAEGYHWLIEAYLQYLPPTRSLLSHFGGAMAWHNVEYNTNYSFQNLPPPPARDTPEQRMGMFNDSYSRGEDNGYYNDNGSLSEGYALIGSGSEDDFDRDAVLTWLRGQNNFYGGETVGGGAATNIYTRFPNVPYEAAYAQTTHLNAEYSSGTYNLWRDFIYTEAAVTTPFTPPHNTAGGPRTAIFDPVYDGRRGTEFFRDRMGYRLVLRDANASEWVATNGTLVFEGKIQNVGFGNIFNQKDVWVILRPTSGGSTVYKALTSLDARDWLTDGADNPSGRNPFTDPPNNRPDNTAAWRNLNFSIALSAFDTLPPAGDYNIYLRVVDPNETTIGTATPQRHIRFANNGGIWDAALGANLIGTTEVR